MDYYQQIRSIFAKWAKDYQEMPEGEEKEKMFEDMKRAVDWFYGTIQIESTNNDS